MNEVRRAKLIRIADAEVLEFRQGHFVFFVSGLMSPIISGLT